MKKSIAKASESGSNYCKMADGTLIQWGANIEVNSGTYETIVNFDIPFISVPSFSAVASWINEEKMFVVANCSNTQATVFVRGNTHGITKGMRFSWMAIGRWK